MQQAELIGDSGPALADPFGNSALIPAAFDQRGEGSRGLDRIQVFALQILDQGERQPILRRRLGDDHRHSDQLGQLRRAPTTFARDQLITAGRQRLHD